MREIYYSFEIPLLSLKVATTFKLFKLLDASGVGLSLTEHAAMLPAASVSGRLLAPMLCLCLGVVQVATASSNKTTEIWKSVDEFVVLAPQDALTGNPVPRNDQPVVIEPANLATALAKLRVHEGSAPEAVPLFGNDAARKLATPLSTALSRAAADQDILFAIETLQKAAIFGSKPVSVAGRAFYQNQRLHLIIGELHVSTVPPEYKNYPIGYPKPDRRLHPHQTGERANAPRNLHTAW